MMFEDILEAYVRMLVAGVEPARARCVMNLYLEDL